MHNEYGDFVNSSFIRKNYICKKKEFSDRGLLWVVLLGIPIVSIGMVVVLVRNEIEKVI